MAELIPLSYRLQVVQRQQLAKWYLIAGAVAVMVLASIGGIFLWEHQCWSAHQALAAQYRDKSTLISSAQEVRASREELAKRMTKIQQLREDRVLLSLLENTADGFSSKDLLQSVSIDTRAKDQNHPNADADATHYSVHLSGITESSSSLADLMIRLGKRTQPPINVLLQSSHRDKVLDSQVMRFEIICEQPEPKGT